MSADKHERSLMVATFLAWPSVAEEMVNKDAWKLNEDYKLNIVYKDNII